MRAIAIRRERESVNADTISNGTDWWRCGRIAQAIRVRALPVYGVIASRFKVTAGLMFSPTRRVRYGRPIVVVSGLPRSGTSMMMQMLGAGGLPLMTDDARAPDASNPAGYFELEAVNDLEKGF